MAASMFPHKICGMTLWVGGREAAEDEKFLKDNDIRFVISAVGHHNNPFLYPIEPSDVFKTFCLPAAFEGDGRME